MASASISDIDASAINAAVAINAAATITTASAIPYDSYNSMCKTVRLYGPQGIRMLSNGYFCVTTITPQCVQIFKKDYFGILLIKKISMNCDVSSKLMFPINVCVSPDENKLFVSDIANNQIQVFLMTDGSYERSIDLFGLRGHDCGNNQFDNQFYKPSGLCVSPDGELLFVCDQYNHQIQVFRVDNGEFVRKFGSKGTDNGQFNQPTAICFSQDGTLMFIADSYNHRIQLFSVSNSEFGKFGKFCEFEFVRLIGSNGRSNGQFNYPNDICLSKDGKLLYVADLCNRQIQVMNVSDGKYVKTINVTSGPAGICLSPNEKFLFVTKPNVNQVQILNIS
jgi:sugar lactone lactonase YvrE